MLPAVHRSNLDVHGFCHKPFLCNLTEEPVTSMRGSKGLHHCAVFPHGRPCSFLFVQSLVRVWVKFDWLCISLQELGLGQPLTLPGEPLLSSVETLDHVVWSVEESFKHSLSWPPSCGATIP